MTKDQVKDLQYKLRKVLNMSLSIDGDYGPSTTNAVTQFQHEHGLVTDGVAGVKTLTRLAEVYTNRFTINSGLLNLGKRRFVVFVDAGHGGIGDDGTYQTAGKRAYHEGTALHERGHYYEGYENRLIAEAFIEKCTEVGIMCIRTYHPSKDTSLSDRTEIIRSYLRRGYYGYLHSFHSNAISSNNSKEKLDATRGFMVFTTTDSNTSDKIAQIHLDNVKDFIPFGWNIREDLDDGDSDYEANFQVLRETDLQEFKKFGAILEEWGFHSSQLDAEFITDEPAREHRADIALATALKVKQLLEDESI